MKNKKVINVWLTREDMQNILNWQTLSAIDFDSSDEDEALRKRLWNIYKTEFGEDTLTGRSNV